MEPISNSSDNAGKEIKIADWIEFGQVSAERDENLSSYFYENGVLEAAIKNRHQFLILGRKGAGKTAVFQHFFSNEKNYITKKIIQKAFLFKTTVGTYIIYYRAKVKPRRFRTFNLGNIYYI